MGDRRQRMPIVRMHIGEGPNNSFQTKSTRDPRILIDIVMVIIVDELMSKRLTENDPDNGHKEKTNNNGAGPFLVSTRLETRTDVSLLTLVPRSRDSHGKARLEAENLGVKVESSKVDRPLPGWCYLRRAHY